MSLFDYSFVIFIAVVYPVISFFSFHRLLKRIAAGTKVDRAALYRNTIVSHWTLFLVCLALWIGMDRPWPTLGFGFQADLSFLVACALTIGGIVLLAMQIGNLRSASAEELQVARSQLGNLSVVLPRTRRELAHFYGLSVTAGIVEEVLWRGYLIWFFSLFMPYWAAALVSVVGFGLAHAYQGAKNIPRVMLVGAAFAGLFVLSGSLWLPMILHAAVDILQGRLAYELVSKDDGGNAAGAVAGVNAS